MFEGVSECIIMGVPINIGTGGFKLLHKYPLINIYTCNLATVKINVN